MRNAFTRVYQHQRQRLRLLPPPSRLELRFPFPLSFRPFHILHSLSALSVFISAIPNNYSQMSAKSPIFPMPEPQHFSDYGFDPQIDYFQVLEEAMRHKRETARSIDSIHFKLQKPISKDDSGKIHKPKRKRWWKTALLFFKWRRPHHSTRAHHQRDVDDDVHRARARAFRASVSGPVYLTESRSGSTTPYRTTSRPSSGPLAKGELDIPYLSLRQLTMEQHQLQLQRMSTSAMPIYLVT